MAELDYWEQLVNKYRHKGLLLDANLLVNFLIGSISPERFASGKSRPAFFDKNDFTLLAQIIKEFARLYTTPHILTEVSNLAGRVPEHLRNAYYRCFAELLRSLEEKPLAALPLSRSAYFPKFGLTDVGILQLAPKKMLVLTMDASLANLLHNQGVDVINFKHLQTWRRNTLQ